MLGNICGSDLRCVSWSHHLHSVGRRDVNLGKKEAVYGGNLLGHQICRRSLNHRMKLKSANFPKIPRAAVFPITSDPHACVGFIEVEGHSS